MGILFPFVIALITVFGFLIAISKIEQLLGQVTSLRAFLDQATEILSNAIDKHDEIWIVCPSPYIGNISLRGHKSQKAFRNALDKAALNGRVTLHIAALGPEELRAYYNDFAIDERYTRSDVSDAFIELESILVRMQDKALHNEFYCKMDQPEFFLVATDYEAVIASGLFLPVVTSETEPLSPSTSITTASDKSGFQAKKVELIGFSTRDGGTLESLRYAFEFTRRKTQLLTGIGSISAALNKWKSVPSNQGTNEEEA